MESRTRFFSKYKNNGFFDWAVPSIFALGGIAGSAGCCDMHHQFTMAHPTKRRGANIAGKISVPCKKSAMSSSSRPSRTEPERYKVLRCHSNGGSASALPLPPPTSTGGRHLGRWRTDRHRPQPADGPEPSHSHSSGYPKGLPSVLYSSNRDV